MKTFKIYGQKYPLQSTTSEPYIAYAVKNELVDDPPKGKVVGYVKMEDGSVIECYKRFNIWIILLPIILALLVGVGVFIYLMFFQEKDVVIFGAPVKQGVDNLIVTYNGYPAIRDNKLSINYQNGSLPARILVEGEGIETQVTNVNPDDYVGELPCKFTTDEGVVSATITIETATSKQTFPIAIEIPDNLNGNEAESGLEGFWHGEEIYGAQ